MNKTTFERLKPLLYKKSYKTRLFLYFLAEGYSVNEIVHMKLEEINKQLSSMPKLLRMDAEALLQEASGSEDDIAFRFNYPSGQKYPTKRVMSMVYTAFSNAPYKLTSIDAYLKYLHGATTE